MQIWPTVQIRSGMCVRLSQGDYDRVTVYGECPADMAVRWVNDGAFGLHLVDLDAARNGTTDNFDSIVKIARQAKVPLMMGGGIGDEETIQKFLEVGIDRLIIDTEALKDPLWAIQMASKYPQKIMVGLDVREGCLGPEDSQPTTHLSVVEFAQQMAAHPIAGIILTDIAKEGTMAGPNFEAQKQLRDAVNVPVVAAGGVATTDDVAKLAAMKLDGCVIGRALYEGRLTLEDSFKAAWRGGVETTRPATLETTPESAEPANRVNRNFSTFDESSGASTP